MNERAKEELEIAKELDGMERSVTSWEADFLDTVLPILRSGRALSVERRKVLLKMRSKYLGVESQADDDPGDDEFM